MFLSQLFESTIKHASFCFGRMNPPTLGHGQLIDTVAQASQGGDYFVFASGTQDKKKNPLDYATKIKFLRALFPEQASHIVNDPTLKTIMQVAEWLYAQGFRSVTFVAGSDRLDSFKQLLNDYNGVEGKNVYYKFDSINFVSSGERDPDADGIAGISASGARDAAVNGDVRAFAQATGAGKLTQPLYDAVRKGMLLSDPELAEATAPHQHTEVIRHPVGKWIIYLNDHAATRAMTREIGPRMMTDLLTQVAIIPNLEDKVSINGPGFWIQDNKTKSSFYFKRLDIPGEPFAVRCETGLKDDPRVSKNMPIFRVNAYTGPERPEHIKAMKMAKHVNRFVGINTMATNFAHTMQQSRPDASKEIIRNPATQDSSRYDRAFNQKNKKDEMAECSGYIPKNKKEAKDPRWSNSLTVDIKPGAINKNLKALRLI